jgi:hypothetical protein
MRTVARVRGDAGVPAVASPGTHVPNEGRCRGAAALRRTPRALHAAGKPRVWRLDERGTRVAPLDDVKPRILLIWTARAVLVLPLSAFLPSACTAAVAPGDPPATPWLCNLVNGAWSCSPDDGAPTCPANVVEQELCESGGPDSGACTTWSCIDAGSVVDAASADVAEEEGDSRSPEASPDASRVVASEAGAPDTSAPRPVAEAGPTGGLCAPDEPCGGVTACTVACYGALCCELSCTCQDPYGGTGNPDDPSATLTCMASCP